MIRFALLARGRTGAMHAYNLARASGACLSTIYDPVVATTAPLHGSQVAEGPEDAPRDADVVLIATSTSTHADLFKLSAKAEKTILCEKQIDLNRVKACRDAIGGRDVPIHIGSNRRFGPGFKAARDARTSRRRDQSIGAGHRQPVRPRHAAFDDGYRALVLAEAALASVKNGWTQDRGHRLNEPAPRASGVCHPHFEGRS